MLPSLLVLFLRLRFREIKERERLERSFLRNGVFDTNQVCVTFIKREASVQTLAETFPTKINLIFHRRFILNKFVAKTLKANKIATKTF